MLRSIKNDGLVYRITFTWVYIAGHIADARNYGIMKVRTTCLNLHCYHDNVVLHTLTCQ